MHRLLQSITLAGLCLFAPVAGAGNGVTHVRVEGMLDVGTLALLERACDHAEAADHAALILDLDTPGGEIELM
jgi:membrane-bound ClpP family serine protease